MTSLPLAAQAMTTKPEPHFPPDISLARQPLLEAWLEIRWQLEPPEPAPLRRDPNYPFALGSMYDLVKTRFPFREELEASRAPLEVLPNVVRHRFRPAENEWPVLQLGPGVATVNLVRPYSWKQLRESAEFLRSNLLAAYGNSLPPLDFCALRYRNAAPFEFTQSNVIDFVRSSLNSQIQLPAHVPGFAASTENPTSLLLVTTYDLAQPKGTGRIQLGTGKGRTPDAPPPSERADELVLWDIEITSGGVDVPDISDPVCFSQWLDDAHAVIHEWFFSLIDGAFLKEYLKG